MLRPGVASHLGELVSTRVTVNSQETSVTDTHAYAAAVRKEYLDGVEDTYKTALEDGRAKAPGVNPGAVTDEILLAAIADINTV